jgi:bifunctional UDP-N-acetylglucosamine pyrophosphorylase/glucosamine-1-phosphate N-acetyltransferase
MAGRPLVHYPIKAALEAGASRVIVVCSEDSMTAIQTNLAAAFGDAQIECRIQLEARGTGDAARVGINECKSDIVAILYGDAPLVDADNLRTLRSVLEHNSASLVVQSCIMHDPGSYGRIVRNADQNVIAIREYSDLRDDYERGVNEVNAGIYVGNREVLAAALGRIGPNNEQGEYYLTDVVEDIANSTLVLAHRGNPDSLRGVNDRVQLEEAESIMYQRIARRHALAGVTIRGDARIEDAVEIEPDATIEFGVSLRGRTTILSDAVVDVGCVIVDSSIGHNASIKPYSVIEKSSVGDGAQVGPFAHLRPESTIEQDAHIGNFVETKKTIVRRGAKANHLSYLGDGDIGEKANVGAGTIFCNYDGYRKHKTVIGPRAFVGSDSQLVAPVTIGEGAYVASGTTVTKDVPDDALAISRVKQENRLGYGARLRARLAGAAGKKT